MKEFEEIGPFNLNKLFETPQKKDKTVKKSSDVKVISPIHLDKKQKFDLSESPRFKVSTDIRAEQQSSSLKPHLSESVKKQYSSPMMVKVEESPYSSIDRLISLKKHKETMQKLYGNLKLKDNFNRCYTNIIQQIQAGHLVEFPDPEIIDEENEDEHAYSQLVNFPLNSKNSRKLVYQQEKHTLIPVYQCLGCNTQFDNSPALGGHLRSCYKKQIHYHLLQRYFRACEIGQIFSSSFEPFSADSDQSLHKGRVKVELLKTPEKIAKIQDEKINMATQKQKDNNSVFFSSENKSSSKSVQSSQKPFDEKESIYRNKSNESEDDEAYEEGSEEYNPRNEKTVKKQKRLKGGRDMKRGKNGKFIRKH